MDEKHLFLAIENYTEDNIMFLYNIYKYCSDNKINNIYLYITNFFDNYGNDVESNYDKLDRFISLFCSFNVKCNFLIDLNESMYCDFSDYKKIEESRRVKILYSDIIKLNFLNNNYDVISAMDCLGYDEDGNYDWDEESVHFFEKDILKANKKFNKIIITRDSKTFKERFGLFVNEYSNDLNSIYVDFLERNNKQVGIVVDCFGTHELIFEEGIFRW